MNQHATRLWATLLTLSLLLSLSACGNDTTTAATMHLKRTVGTVTVSDGTGKDVPLLEDLNLYSGYGVDTSSESYAWINLDDVKLTKMNQESKIAIQKEGKDLEIEIRSGSLLFNVTQPLEDDETMDIRTSTMLIGIRGTCGWVEDRNGHSRVYILEGTVECSTGSQMLVKEIEETEDPYRKSVLRLIYSLVSEEVTVDLPTLTRAEEIRHCSNIKYKDSIHLACAEAAGADALLTTDKKFLNNCNRIQTYTKVMNPNQWLLEVLY